MHSSTIHPRNNLENFPLKEKRQSCYLFEGIVLGNKHLFNNYITKTSYEDVFGGRGGGGGGGGEEFSFLCGLT